MATLLETLGEMNATRRRPARITLPGMESTGAAPLNFGGRGYGNSSARAYDLPDQPGGALPPGTDINAASNIGQATVARNRLSPDLQGIATVTPDNPLPSIHGGDYARLREARALTMPSPAQLGNVQQTNPLAEKQAAERAMGRSVESTVANMRLSRGYPRTLEGMARMEDRNFRAGNESTARREGFDNRLQQLQTQGQNAIGAIAAEGQAQQDRDLTQAGIAKDAARNQIVFDQTRSNLGLTIPGQTDPNAIAKATVDGVRMGLREQLNQDPARPGGFTMPANGGSGTPAANAPQPQAPSAPPPSAIARLKSMANDPQADAEFDAIFGPGAAARARGQ